MTGTVKLRSFDMNTSAAMNSFQDVMKANSATVTMPGTTSGRQTRRKT